MNDTHLEEMLIINQLQSVVEAGEIEKTINVLKELQEHTKDHFSNEESMMQEAKFPAYEVHKAEHDRHLGELQSVLNYFQKHQDPLAIVSYINGTLVSWLTHHIQTMDTMTATFLTQGSQA
jgi:hemerythrin